MQDTWAQNASQPAFCRHHLILLSLKFEHFQLMFEIRCLKYSVLSGRSLFTLQRQSTKRCVRFSTFLAMPFGKLQQVGQEVLLLNLLCSCVWSDILDGVHDANSPDGFKLHCLAHKNKISLRLVNRKIYQHKIRECARSRIVSAREALFHICSQGARLLNFWNFQGVLWFGYRRCRVLIVLGFGLI